MDNLFSVGINEDLRIILEGEGRDELVKIIKNAVKDDAADRLTVEVLTFRDKTKLRICEKKNFANILCKVCGGRLTSFVDDYTMSTCRSCLKKAEVKDDG